MKIKVKLRCEWSTIWYPKQKCRKVSLFNRDCIRGIALCKLHLKKYDKECEAIKADSWGTYHP